MDSVISVMIRNRWDSGIMVSRRVGMVLNNETSH